MKITARTKGGGAVTLNKKHGIWASYNTKPCEILHAIGLVVVDVVDKDEKGGVEILRKMV
jgi:hypothetical protein